MFRYQIEGMTCSACSSHVERAVSKLPFVKKARVSLLSSSMTVETKDGQAHQEEMEQTGKDAAYRAIALEVAPGGGPRVARKGLPRGAWALATQPPATLPLTARTRRCR